MPSYQVYEWDFNPRTGELEAKWTEKQMNTIDVTPLKNTNHAHKKTNRDGCAYRLRAMWARWFS